MSEYPQHCYKSSSVVVTIARESSLCAIVSWIDGAVFLAVSCSTAGDKSFTAPATISL